MTSRLILTLLSDMFHLLMVLSMMGGMLYQLNRLDGMTRREAFKNVFFVRGIARLASLFTVSRPLLVGSPVITRDGRRGFANDECDGVYKVIFIAPHAGVEYFLESELRPVRAAYRGFWTDEYDG